MPMYTVSLPGDWSITLDAFSHHNAAIDAAAPKEDWDHLKFALVTVKVTDENGLVKWFNVWRKLRPVYDAKEVAAGE